ncbi:MAG: hypothetical protein HWD84_03550 [Flavobacteriaceae bacterium]|jgi:hypothetical protein|nr:hypothetical protein [Flavobacteriaceae bacterium]NVJ72327.1 hypothetical protein [Flavobacteriaceae bacterium]
MSTKFIYFLTTMAAALFIYNLTIIDYDNPFEGDSFTAVVSGMIDAIAIVLLLILVQAKKIKEKSDQ